ncbi:hypothetical protein Lnau_0196 [Legionella nautarum]|uniref:PelD GGDEF domain-containing protein n=1 Tax=Legionella nautarum TaxID=45070 RepID=A0A0W0X499_9GAMM|nr:PelD GGDEF domain-containing protein [Legionella nautarum]KTD39429.1 hypothetical protein Lnau_0196 [Legionella nautarum]
MDNKLFLKKLWTWRQSNLWMWGEPVVLTLLALGFCYLIHPTNPLFVREIFPWPWLIPVIVVFQYGFGPALLSVALIIFVAVIQKDTGMFPIRDFQSYILSGMTLILVCTIVSSSWIRRILNAEVLQTYNDERLKSLSRSYYMLRVSSDYLEQNIISKPMTLRLAFKELLKLNLNEHNELTPEVAYSFLQLISQFCQINIGGIYLYQAKQLNSEPFAEVGLIGKLIEQDPLIKKCLDSEQVCYVSINQIEDTSDCVYLVAAPLISNDYRCLGILVIKEMPFWNLNDETLRILNILVYYFSKEIIVSSDISHFLHQYPECSVDFARQLNRLIPLKKDFDVDSALVAVMVSKKLRPHNVIENLKNQHRLLDSNWSLEQDDYDVLITLMPFTAAAGIHGYITRIKNYLNFDLGLSFDNGQIKTRSIQLYNDEPLTVMNYFLNFIKEKNIDESN